MFTLRKSNERGHVKSTWLDSRHTFSFGDYYDPHHTRFGSLRVINEDIVAPNSGFDTHPHKDMEIITYILSGALEHKDSLGTGSVIRPGDVQRMTAGIGIQHSERNYSKTEPVHLLQIWIFPNQKNLTPSYEQLTFSPEQMQNKFCLVASGDARENSILIHQDAELYIAKLDKEKIIDFFLNPNRHAWLQIARGKILLNNMELQAGDGVAISDVSEIKLIAQEAAEILLFNLA